MNTEIFVPTIGSDASWIFCNREIAFHNGLLNAAGKILTGFQNRQDAIDAMLAKQPAEPFALLRLVLSNGTQQLLAQKGWMKGTETSSNGAPLWTICQAGSIFLNTCEGAQLLMEYIPVPQRFTLY
jgi:hypothetical protein